MSAEALRGAPIAAAFKEQARALSAGAPRPPCLLNVVVGARPDQASYLAALERAAAQRGFASHRLALPEDVSQDRLCRALAATASDDAVDGVLLQLPLPPGLSRQAVTAAIPPAKDVDGVTQSSLGTVLAGERCHRAPATAAAVVELLDSDPRLDPGGRSVVVIGRSLVVGRPLAAMLSSPGRGGDATVTVCHTRTPDLAAVTRRAQILVAAAGVRHLVTPAMVAPGAVVIDVGTHPRPDGEGLDGDVHPDVEAVAGFLTPVTGGVGAVTTAVLMRHVLAAALPGRLAPAW